ncbi:transcriptional regulator [Danxiaibacter flavus]|uniref:Transcriptional regulator n=1 Tax=Danxiaibacter flavus TaxID=3049108 RepID=A0ABV3ZLC5_9BACT|nr:transcriptional regulator [Chitinophagaceae bacterium DXS]
MRQDIFQAIADPSRRMILSLMALLFMTLNTITVYFNSSRKVLSKYLQILAGSKLLEQKQGREIYYYFNPQKMKEVYKWLEQFRRLWEKRLDRLDNVLTQIKSTAK